MTGKKLEYQLDKEADYELAAEQELRFEVENGEKVGAFISISSSRFINIILSSPFTDANQHDFIINRFTQFTTL